MASSSSSFASWTKVPGDRHSGDAGVCRGFCQPSWASSLPQRRGAGAGTCQPRLVWTRHAGMSGPSPVPIRINRGDRTKRSWGTIPKMGGSRRDQLAAAVGLRRKKMLAIGPLGGGLHTRGGGCVAWSLSAAPWRVCYLCSETATDGSGALLRKLTHAFPGSAVSDDASLSDTYEHEHKNIRGSASMALMAQTASTGFPRPAHASSA